MRGGVDLTRTDPASIVTVLTRSCGRSSSSSGTDGFAILRHTQGLHYLSHYIAIIAFARAGGLLRGQRAWRNLFVRELGSCSREDAMMIIHDGDGGGEKTMEEHAICAIVDSSGGSLLDERMVEMIKGCVCVSH